ncbi:FHA domain-containing protein [Isosphaeraceae bacterium EP7]
MPPSHGNLGILRPVGGGDPVQIEKAELTIGRRASNDIMLDFENVSSKHCVMRLINGVWNVRDLGSTNGTTINGLRINSEQTVMPDDELGIASHLFKIDYEPSGQAVIAASSLFDEELAEARGKRTSLLELAGLADEDKPRRTRPSKAPEKIERLAADEGDFEETMPRDFKHGKVAADATSDEDFLKFIEDELK